MCWLVWRSTLVTNTHLENCRNKTSGTYKRQVIEGISDYCDESHKNFWQNKYLKKSCLTLSKLLRRQSHCLEVSTTPCFLHRVTVAARQISCKSLGFFSSYMSRRFREICPTYYYQRIIIAQYSLNKMHSCIGRQLNYFEISFQNIKDKF